jgi:hypothetical protein
MAAESVARFRRPKQNTKAPKHNGSGGLLFWKGTYEEMLKPILILLLPALLAVQCGARHPKPPGRVDQDPQRVNRNPEKNKCDFSKFKPMKARASYGSPIVSMPQPEYPAASKGSGIQGKVTVLLLVNVRSGLVEQACVVEGDEPFTSSAKDAGLSVKFKPYSSYIQKTYSYAEEIVTYNFLGQ